VGRVKKRLDVFGLGVIQKEQRVPSMAGSDKLRMGGKRLLDGPRKE